MTQSKLGGPILQAFEGRSVRVFTAAGKVVDFIFIDGGRL
ncbi:MAG: hypothetical protein GQF41_2611 [Candidatus Rifleibacterium amylolyticum]|nr:MAG: hypothetical protein GQF41_2611 [Candidatus Rifleibacterium amylolyticum]